MSTRSGGESALARWRVRRAAQQTCVLGLAGERARVFRQSWTGRDERKVFDVGRRDGVGQRTTITEKAVEAVKLRFRSGDTERGREVGLGIGVYAQDLPPRRAKAAPMFTQAVVFPTPPFSLAKAIAYWRP